MAVHDILNELAGRIALAILLSYAATKALDEWRDWAIRKLHQKYRVVSEDELLAALQRDYPR